VQPPDTNTVYVERAGVQHRTLAAAFVAVILVGGQAVKANKWGVGVDLAGTPMRAAEMLSKADVRGTVLGFFHLGNYLAWSLYPKAKVIADARHFGFNESLRLHDHLFSAPDGWESQLHQARVAAAVTPMTMPYSGGFPPLALALEAAWERALAELEFNLSEYPDSVLTMKSRELARMAKQKIAR
jgi:hypothetical protein